ncbi:MAG: hypothetical protein H6974_05850 [Gammaproteobacteria bacterium]|nr:hypothetical protein [Gammaproteobacteria bacterium]
MLFLGSILILYVVLFLAILLGRRVTIFLPNQLKWKIEFYVAPGLGLALLTIIATFYGWFFPFKSIGTILLVIGLAVWSFWVEKDRYGFLRDSLAVLGFAFFASFPTLGQLIISDGFNPFNDTFTYLVHGQWLQTHPFLEKAVASGHYPALTQVVLYQSAGHRMGASFFLGFVQSLFHLEWSYYAYSAVVATLVVGGSLAVGAVVRLICPMRKVVGLAICMLPAVTSNGFVFGAQFGFMPQTFGLAFLPLAIALIVSAIADGQQNNDASWLNLIKRMLPSAVAISALLYSYNDMFPIFAAGIVLFALVVALRHHARDLRQVVTHLAVLGITVTLIVNVEVVRILRNLLHTVIGAGSGQVIFGWPVPWSPAEFLSFSFGLKLPFETLPLVDRVLTFGILPFVVIAVIISWWIVARRARTFLPVAMIIAVVLVLVSAFLKFRYATDVPGSSIGHSFLQFKIAQWAAPIAATMMGVACASVFFWLKRSHYFVARVVSTFGFLLILGVAIWGHLRIASPIYLQQLLDETKTTSSSFSSFLALRNLVQHIPSSDIIYLNFGAEHHKLRQMAAYILMDRKLASDYSDDGYILGHLPPSEREMPVGGAPWMIMRATTADVLVSRTARSGPFVLKKAPYWDFVLHQVTGAYATESDAANSWNWVESAAQYSYHGSGESTKIRVAFEYLLAGPPRQLSIQVIDSSETSSATFFDHTLNMAGGWGKFQSDWVSIHPAKDITVKFTADGEPVRLSENDPRQASFLIRNLLIETELVDR